MFVPRSLRSFTFSTVRFTTVFFHFLPTKLTFLSLRRHRRFRLSLGSRSC
jgi:hypothetical protein